MANSLILLTLISLTGCALEDIFHPKEQPKDIQIGPCTADTTRVLDTTGVKWCGEPRPPGF